jgi:hypothetical protein
MRKFRLSRPAVSSEQTLDRRGSSFHKYEPFMARWRSIAEEKLNHDILFSVVRSRRFIPADRNLS